MSGTVLSTSEVLTLLILLTTQEVDAFIISIVLMWNGSIEVKKLAQRHKLVSGKAFLSANTSQCTILKAIAE